MTINEEFREWAHKHELDLWLIEAENGYGAILDLWRHWLYNVKGAGQQKGVPL